MKYNIVSYASGRFLKSQKILEEKCYSYGANKVFSYNYNDLDTAFINKNKKAFSHARGGGYWVWKPYVIKKALSNIQEGERLVYLDAGMYPIAPIDLLFSDEDIISFEMYDQLHANWTKYDCYHLMQSLDKKYFLPKQRQAAFQIYINNKFSREFIEEYLYYCEYENNSCITDEKSIYGKDLNGFKENRHDQSVYTNLCIKYNIKAHRDPSQWGNPHKQFYNDTYPQIFNLHRGII